ncbi:MAG: phage holin family protein [Rhodospirillaceae bacterium]
MDHTTHGTGPYERADRPYADRPRDTRRGIGSLINDLGRDLTRLMSDEVQLARAEAGESVNTIIMALVSIASGLAFALAALIILLQAMVAALSQVMEPWLASVIVGIGAAIVGFILAMGGQKALKARNLAPNRTARNLQRDAKAVKEHV